MSADLTAAEAALLASLAMGPTVTYQSDDAALLALESRGLVAKRRRAWVATPEGLAAIRRDIKPLFVERHQ